MFNRWWTLAAATALALGAASRSVAGDARSSGDHGASKWRLTRQLVVDEEAWKWNWASWDREKILTFGDFQYTIYWDSDRVLALVRRDLRNDDVEVLRLPQYTLSSDNSHRNTCLGYSLADGRLHLSWDHHVTPLRYTKSRPAFLTRPPARLGPADIEPAGPMLSPPELESQVTYPQFLNDRRGSLYLFYRIGVSGNGDYYLHRYNAADGSWARLGMVLSRKGTYPPWENSKSRCAYVHDMLFDDRNRLHASWVYREAGGSWASNHDLHYAYSDDGGITWRNNAGDMVADLAKDDAIELEDPGILVVNIPVYSWLMNQGGMALDSKNRPHVVTFMSRVVHRPAKLAHDPPPHIRDELRFVHFWRSDDGKWQKGDFIDPASLGMGRGDMVFDECDNAYFFYGSLGGFRCLEARAGDNWATWSNYPLTGSQFRGWESKHDRRRWADKRILSFTGKTGSHGFGIVDFVLGPGIR